MKSLAIVLSLMTRPFRQRRTRLFLWMVLLFVVMVGVYRTLFHVIMEDGRRRRPRGAERGGPARRQRRAHHDDDVNVYLTIYCRRLRPDILIISRANLDRNVATLHRAGADSVLSYASLGATAIWNELDQNDGLVLAEGLEMFRMPMPQAMEGKTLAEPDVRQRTGCNIVAIAEDRQMVTNPDPRTPLPSDAELVVIGDAAARDRFLDTYPLVRPGRRTGAR